MMKNKILPFLTLAILLFACKNTPTNNVKEPFLWGVATCAYQVEGGYQMDGPSKVFMNIKR